MRILRDRDNYRKWYLDEDITHVLHNGDILKINKGYRFDAHSVPRPFRWVFQQYDGRDILAALVHDYLVDTAPWHRYNRRFIDREYTSLMQLYATKHRAFFMPLAVRLYGFLAFDLWCDYRGEIKPDTKVEVKVTHL